MNQRESRFLDKINGIKGYVDGMHKKEPGWFYDNFGEFGGLVNEMLSLGESEGYTYPDEILNIMTFLQSDIDEAKRRIEHPIRNPEEQNFYRRIVGVNSYIYETKQGNPNWVFDNVREVNDPSWPNGCLLDRLEELKTQDSDILTIMDTITKDIKKTISSREGLEAAEEYQERLTALGIGKTEQLQK